MIKRIVFDHVNGQVELGNYLTETEDFEKKDDINPFTKERIEQIGFYQIGKKRRTWLTLGKNVKEVRILNAETNELLERIVTPEGKRNKWKTEKEDK